MRIGLFYPGYIPKEGGTGYVLKCLIEALHNKSEKLYFFNPYDNGKNSFKIQEIQKYSLKTLISILIHKKSLKVILKTFWKILIDKKTKFSDKIRIISFLVIKPQIFISTFLNLEKILPIVQFLNLDVILGGATTEYILPLIYILSILLNKKVCSLTYGNDFLVKSRFSFQSFYIRNLDLIILGTYSMKNLIKKIHPLNEEQLVVIRYGLNFDDYNVNASKSELREKYNISENDFILLSVGRHVSRKNFDMVIKAINFMKNGLKITNIKYYLIGEGDATSNLKELTKELNLEDSVIFLGFVSKLVRNSFFKLSDLFLMPSSREKESIEGFGIVFIEANYFKCPVIGTYSGGISEAIINNVTGLLVKENDFEDLLKKILFIYNNKEIAKEMGVNGYQRIIKDFNWDIIVNDYIDIFRKLLDLKLD
ncbi:MAG: glycosyltransferase family 4 protein [Promethearchaeota archaeon]